MPRISRPAATVALAAALAGTLALPPAQAAVRPLDRAAAAPEAALDADLLGQTGLLGNTAMDVTGTEAVVEEAVEVARKRLFRRGPFLRRRALRRRAFRRGFRRGLNRGYYVRPSIGRYHYYRGRPFFWRNGVRVFVDTPNVGATIIFR